MAQYCPSDIDVAGILHARSRATNLIFLLLSLTGADLDNKESSRFKVWSPDDNSNNPKGKTNHHSLDSYNNLKSPTDQTFQGKNGILQSTLTL